MLELKLCCILLRRASFYPSRNIFSHLSRWFCVKTCNFTCQDDRCADEGWQSIMSHTSVTTYQKCFIFQQWWSKREKWVYFYPKLVASRIRCLHLEISHTFHCTRVQALIIHPETLADAAWLFTYLEVCLPLGLHLQLSIRSAMHSTVSRVIDSQLPAIFSLGGDLTGNTFLYKVHLSSVPQSQVLSTVIRSCASLTLENLVCRFTMNFNLGLIQFVLVSCIMNHNGL